MTSTSRIDLQATVRPLPDSQKGASGTGRRARPE